jgi:assimilatory nitrate reductase catalytic subunit
VSSDPVSAHDRQQAEACARIVVIDPRQTETWRRRSVSRLKPGTDTALFSGLLTYLADNGALDHALHRQTYQRLSKKGLRKRAHCRQYCRDRAGNGLAEADVAAFFQMFAKTHRVVTLYSQGVNQSAQGTDKVNAIINCHLATGRIGKPGASPFSLTGQPNAMGGREVGGLANQLAAHMGFTPPDIDRVRRFWKAPRIATHEGLKAVQMFQAIGRGEIKALVGDGHQSGGVLAECRRRPRCDEETRPVGDLGERAVQRQHQFRRACTATRARMGREVRHRYQLRAPYFPPARIPAGAGRGESRLVDHERGGKRLGYGAAFAYNSAADIFREHAEPLRSRMAAAAISTSARWRL